METKKTKIVDFLPDQSPPNSIRELVIGSLTDSEFREVDSIEALLKRVYAHIEKQALEVYHSNEPWALKSWALQNILKDEIVSSATEISGNLISPIIEWQGESYDPIKEFEKKLIADGKLSHTIEMYLVAVAKFVAKVGRKRHYSDKDIISYVADLRHKGRPITDKETGKITWIPYRQVSLRGEVTRLRQFFLFLHGKNWEMPVAIPKIDDDENIRRPMFSDEDIEWLIFSCLINVDKLPARWIVRLAVATIYGARISELGALTSKDVKLDGADSTIYIRTRKGGQRKPQPIPTSLVPLFAIDIEPLKLWEMMYSLKSMCKKADVKLPEQSGWHSIRRWLSTTLYNNNSLKEMDIIRFMRWSTNGLRHLGQLPTYVRTPTEVSDKKVLEQNPAVKIWAEIIPYLVSWHKEYASNPRVKQLISYSENIYYIIRI